MPLDRLVTTAMLSSPATLKALIGAFFIENVAPDVIKISAGLRALNKFIVDFFV